MCTYSSLRVRLIGMVIAVAGLALANHPTIAAVKVIGDFEGSMASGYAGVDWATGSGIVTPPEFISINDPDYLGGVTHGEQALLFTTPNRWGELTGDVFLQIYPNEALLDDTADFPYMLLDVTTYGGADTPDEGPIWRQMFSIFNGAVLGWYDSNPDNDIQRDFPVAGFVEDSFTTTVVVDMTGPDPAVHGDGMNFLNLRSNAIRADHNDGTPIDGFYWGMHFAFQGDDAPLPDPPDPTVPIQLVIDNVRFCDTLDCTPDAALAGDYNDDGSVSAADYVLWRGGGPLQNETVSIGIIDQEDYNEWRAHFGNPAGLGGGAAVPEPASVMLSLVAAWWLLAIRRQK